MREPHRAKGRNERDSAWVPLHDELPYDCAGPPDFGAVPARCLMTPKILKDSVEHEEIWGSCTQDWVESRYTRTVRMAQQMRGRSHRSKSAAAWIRQGLNGDY